MLESDLKQSPYLNIINQGRLNEIAEKLNKSKDFNNDPELVKLIANEAKVNTLLSGRFFKENERLYIGVEMWDMKTCIRLYKYKWFPFFFINLLIELRKRC